MKINPQNNFWQLAYNGNVSYANNGTNTSLSNYVASQNTDNSQSFNVNNLFDSIQRFDEAAQVPSGGNQVKSSKSSESQMPSDADSAQSYAKIKMKVIQYKLEASQGSFNSFMKLENLKAGSDDEFNKLNSSDYMKAMGEVENAVNEVVNAASYSPKILNMFLQASVSDNKNNAPKGANNQNGSSVASYYLSKLFNEGKVNLEKQGDSLIKNGSKDTIKALTQLSSANIPQEARQSIAKLLGKTASKFATSEAGDLATKGLQKMIQQEGQNGVLDQAFDGLAQSAVNGNANSVNVLEKIANANTSSFNKSFKAVKALTEVSKQCPNDSIGSSAVNSLKKISTMQAGNSVGQYAKQSIRIAAESGNTKAQEMVKQESRINFDNPSIFDTNNNQIKRKKADK